MMGKYVLWGKRPDGKNEVQVKNVQLPTRSQLWHKSDTITEESLDELLESPTFKEAQLTNPPAKHVREKFDRTAARASAPDYLQADFENLFNEIDTLDLGICYYEIQHAKRTLPPRPQLISHFSPEQCDTIEREAATWSQFLYLKKRHLLVELRREQYTFADSFTADPLILRPTVNQYEKPTLNFDSEIEVLPAGLKRNQLFWQDPIDLPYTDINTLIHQFWSQKIHSPAFTFDFRELEHVYQLLQFFDDWSVELEDLEDSDTIAALLNTLQYYIQLANLNEIQQFIIDQKIKKVTNVDIALATKEKFGKRYTPNYISTIFRQKIIPKINEAAAYHESLILDLPNPECFKKCTRCGRLLYKHPRNFIRRSSTKDGYGARCKQCEHEVRK